MSKSIEQDNNKTKRRIKIAKILGVCALAFVLAWSVYSAVTNINGDERKIVDAFIEAYDEVKEPALNTLEDCSEIREGTTSGGKSFKYVIAKINQGENEDFFVMIVSGKKKGNLYNAETLSRFDCEQKDNIKLEITEHEPSINIQKVQKTLSRYWKFHDVA